ncbi:hypothetical protein Naga_100715g3 [Nannochloropsis gaditana]|uniref:ABM domain-containing protein n=1 Tax=Nannochloropsis gaditana TaxID=72520 RepID=W7THA9_9STRA|nr:hypothetical protein Naga_100715g3 [Nannochloropsis gaditana]
MHQSSVQKEAERPATLRPEPAIFCIKTFMPHPGQEKELETRLQKHWDALHAAGLTVPNQEPLFLRSRAGRVLEVFEWKDAEAMEEAHRRGELQDTWKKLLEVGTMVPLASLGECSEPYAHFHVVQPGTHEVKDKMVKIVAVKPHTGKLNDLIAKLKKHDVALRKAGYTTGRPAMHMRGEKEGHVVEVAEWASVQKVKEAQKSDDVHGLWNEFNVSVEHNCPLTCLPEAKDRYSLFPAITLHTMSE